MQVDEQGPEIPDAVPEVVDRRRERGRFIDRPLRLRLIGERRERERDARDVLDGAVVEIGRDATALAVRGGDRVREQGLPLLVPALEATDERPDERNLDEHEQGDRAEDRRGQLSEQPASAGGDGVEPLVDLEQDGLPDGVRMPV